MNVVQKYGALAISVLVLLISGSAGYFDLKAQSDNNAEKIADTPERIIRLEERVASLQRQQENLLRQVQESAAESREADDMTLDTLNSIAIAIARLEQQINASQ